MPWWWSRRETGSPYEQADQLYDEAVHLSHVSGREQAAALKALEAAALLRPMLTKRDNTEAKRRLAKALWRHSSALTVRTPAEALPSGREGIALAREVLDATAPQHASFDAALRELVIAMNDLAQAAAMAERLDEREALLREAQTIARRGQGAGARQALGTTLHNLAQHEFQRLSQRSPAEQRAGQASLIALAEEALEIRRRLSEAPRVEDYARWELANSTGQLGRILFMLGGPDERERGLELLARAPDALGSIRLASAEPLRQQLAHELEFCRRLAAEHGAQLAEHDPYGLGQALQPETLCLLKLISLLEMPDRSHQLLRLWFSDQLRAAQLPESPESYQNALQELIDHGLATERACGNHVDISSDVESRVREQTNPQERDRFVRVRAQLWLDRFYADRDKPGPQTVHAGLASSVYARRVRAHAQAFELLEGDVLLVGCRTGEATQVLLHLQLTAAESGERSLLERCDARTRWLATAHYEEGHVDQALTTTALGINFSTTHDLGPVSLATWHKDRLLFLGASGQHEQALAELDVTLALVERARLHTKQDCHALREDAWHHAAGAAKALAQWPRALELNRKRIASMQARGAGAVELARARMSDSAAIMELGDWDAAETLLRACQEELRDHPVATAEVLGERAIVATLRGDFGSARRLKRSSLQLYYEESYWSGVAYAHESYGNELARALEDPLEAGSHWLAAAILYRILGDQAAVGRVILRFKVTVQVAIPDTLEQVIALAQRTPKVELKALLAQTPRDLARIFNEVVQEIRALTPDM